MSSRLEYRDDPKFLGNGLNESSSYKGITFPNWLIASKVAPGYQPAFIIPRPRLEQLFEASLQKTVTMVDAPGGYGKSTLLSQWRDNLIDRGHVVGWLFLDEDDNNPTILLNYIAYALHESGIPLSDTMHELVKGLPHRQTKSSLGLLLNLIADFGRNVLLILDDFEVLNKELIDTLIKPILQLAPKNFHLLLGTRKQGHLSIARMHAQGRVLEVDAAQLRFNSDEIEDVFEGLLSKSDIDQIEELTHGWPVAVQLIRIWINQDPKRISEIKEVSGLTEDIVEYVSDQIIQGLPDPIYSLLMEVAVLRRLSEADVRNVCGSDIAWPALLECEALVPFLIPLEGVEGVYQLHPILKGFFLRRLAQHSPARKRELHEKAAWLYVNSGRLLPAIRQAELTGDLELEAKIIEVAGGVQIWLRHGFAITRSISRMISQDLLDRYPRLALLRALALVKEGQVASARALFRRVKHRSVDFTHDWDDSDPRALRRDGLMIESTLLVNDCSSATDAYLSDYEGLLNEVRGECEVYAGHVSIFLALSYHQRGKFDRARHFAREALEHYTNERAWHGVVFVHLHLGVIAFAEGKADASIHYSNAKDVAKKYFSSDRSKNLLIDTLVAELKYERNQLNSVRRTVVNILGRLKKSEAWLDIFAAACVTTACLEFEEKGLEGVLDTIAKVRRDIESRGVSGLSRFLDAIELLFLSRAGLLDRANELFSGSGMSSVEGLEDIVTWRERELVCLARASFAVRSGRASEVVDECSEAYDLFLKTGNVRSQIRVGTMFACALHQTGQQSAGFEILSAILLRCQETGYVRVFHEERDIVGELLKEFIVQDSGPGIVENDKDFVTRLFHELADVRQSRDSRLTDRELEVLQYLKEGYQDKVIARALNLTQNTVKFHLKNIYRKFEVTSRGEAIREAQRNSL